MGRRPTREDKRYENRHKQMEAGKDQLYYLGNEFCKVQMAELVGLPQVGVPGWERLEVVPDPSWKGVFSPFREIEVYPHV